MRVLTLEEAKQYLRVDSDEDDTLISLLIDYSKEENGNSNTYILAQMLILADRYENRSSNDTEFKPNNALSCIYTRLKTEVV